MRIVIALHEIAGVCLGSAIMWGTHPLMDLMCIKVRLYYSIFAVFIMALKYMLTCQLWALSRKLVFLVWVTCSCSHLHKFICTVRDRGVERKTRGRRGRRITACACQHDFVKYGYLVMWCMI